MGVFTRPSVCTSDGQSEMNKKGDSPDCEFLWRLRDCEARSNRLLQKQGRRAAAAQAHLRALEEKYDWTEIGSFREREKEL